MRVPGGVRVALIARISFGTSSGSKYERRRSRAIGLRCLDGHPYLLIRRRHGTSVLAVDPGRGGVRNRAEHNSGSGGNCYGASAPCSRAVLPREANGGNVGGGRAPSPKGAARAVPSLPRGKPRRGRAQRGDRACGSFGG